MKKTIFGVVILLIGLSFGIPLVSVQAADASMNTTISAADAAKLQTEITQLKGVLSQLQAQVAARMGTPSVPVASAPTGLAAVKAGLDSIKASFAQVQAQVAANGIVLNQGVVNTSLQAMKTNLLALSASLGTYAAKSTASAPATKAPSVAIETPSVSPLPATTPEKTGVALEESKPTLEAPIISEGQSNNTAESENLASVTTGSNANRLPWPAGVVILVLAGATVLLAWFRARREKTMPKPVQALQPIERNYPIKGEEVKRKSA